jgi:hypothetical protein
MDADKASEHAVDADVSGLAQRTNALRLSKLGNNTGVVARSR